LTGADGRIGLSRRAAVHRTVSGAEIDLGLVGIPDGAADVRLVDCLMQDGFVPVVASIGVDESGQLLNVNADAMAGHLAARLRARRLLIAGSTPGVLDDRGTTIAVLDPATLERTIASGTATAGMIAKLRACECALAGGVDEVVVVDGRDVEAVVAAASNRPPKSATRVATTVETER
jgi:acetylglutamate kinase